MQKSHQGVLATIVFVYVPSVRNKSFWVGVKESVRKNVLNDYPIFIDARNTSILTMCMNSRKKSLDTPVLGMRRNRDCIFWARACCRKAPTVIGCRRTTRDTVTSLPRPFHSHRNARRRGWDLCSLRYPQYWNREGTTIWRPSDRRPRAVYSEATGWRTRYPERPVSPSTCTLPSERSWSVPVSVLVESLCSG